MPSFSHQPKSFKSEVEYLLEELGFSKEEIKLTKKSYETFRKDGGIQISITQININIC